MAVGLRVPPRRRRPRVRNVLALVLTSVSAAPVPAPIGGQYRAFAPVRVPVPQFLVAALTSKPETAAVAAAAAPSPEMSKLETTPAPTPTSGSLQQGSLSVLILEPVVTERRPWRTAERRRRLGGWLRLRSVTTVATKARRGARTWRLVRPRRSRPRLCPGPPPGS